MSLFKVDLLSSGEQAGPAAVNVQQWQFYRAGDFDQVMIRRGADLLTLDQLDKIEDFFTRCRLAAYDARAARRAFFASYRRLARFIGTQMEKMARARSKAVNEKLAAGAEGTSWMAGAGKPAPVPFDVAKFAGIFAAIVLRSVSSAPWWWHWSTALSPTLGGRSHWSLSA